MYLGINTGLAPYSIGLSKGGTIVGEVTLPDCYDSGENLIHHIHQLMRQHQAKWTDLTCIAVTTGPGSYTGLRLGVTTAKTLAQVHDIPMVSVSTLEALARQVEGYQTVTLAMIPATKSDVNAAFFGNGPLGRHRITPDFVWDIATCQKKCQDIEEDIHIAGQIPDRLFSALTAHDKLHIIPQHIHGSTLAKLAKEGHDAGKSHAYDHIQIHYSHHPNVGPKQR